MNTYNFSFKKSLYSPTDLFDLGTRLTNAVGEKIAQEPKGAQVVEALKTALVTLNKATERELANPITAMIHEKDGKRDDLLIMIKNILKANVHNALNGEAREGAIELLRLYNDHIGNVHALGFGAETKAVKYLLESFSMEENKKQCTLLGIDRLVTGLAETQNEIETLYAERTMLEPELDQYTLKNATEGAVVAVRRFLGYADLLIAGDETAYSEPGQAIAAILADVEAIARGRKTREENSDDKESGGPENAASEAA